MENEKVNELIKGIFDSLTDEQKQKAADCKTVEELTACLSKMDVSLPDELLDAVAGGTKPPFHKNMHYTHQIWYQCPECRFWMEAEKLKGNGGNCSRCSWPIDTKTAQMDIKTVPIGS